MSRFLQAAIRVLHLLYRGARVLPLLVADIVLLALKHPRQQAGLICLVRLDNIGDFFLWLDSARQLRDFYHGKRIVLVANQAFADFARTLPYWDEVVPVDVAGLERSLAYRWKTFGMLRGMGVETVVQPVFSRVFMTGDAVVRILGAEKRIGSAGDLSNIAGWEKKIADRWYTDLVPARPEPKTELERNAEFLHGLGLVPAPVSLANLPEPMGMGKARRFEFPYLILFAGASWSGKIWPLDLFAQCADEVHARHGWKAVICGGFADVPNAEKIRNGIGSHQAVNVAGQTNLVELVELIRGAQAFIGNDTSGIHIAAAVGVPAVCILGGGHFGRFLPYPSSIEGPKPVAVFHAMACYGCNWNCSQPYIRGEAVPCIRSVGVQEVMAALERALQSNLTKVELHCQLGKG